MAVIWVVETNGQLPLAEESKEELIEEVLRLRQFREELVEELLKLHEENGKLKQALGAREKTEAQKKFLKALRLAERMIRPHVILRNGSFHMRLRGSAALEDVCRSAASLQNRSPQGAQAHETLMSLLHTLKLQGKDTITSLQKAYLRHRQGDFTPILSLWLQGAKQ